MRSSGSSTADTNDSREFTLELAGLTGRKTKRNKTKTILWPTRITVVVWLVIFRRLENYVVRQIFLSFFRSFRIKSAGPSFLSQNQFYLICVGITLALDHTYWIIKFHNFLFEYNCFQDYLHWKNFYRWNILTDLIDVNSPPRLPKNKLQKHRLHNDLHVNSARSKAISTSHTNEPFPLYVNYLSAWEIL